MKLGSGEAPQIHPVKFRMELENQRILDLLVWWLAQIPRMGRAK